MIVLEAISQYFRFLYIKSKRFIRNKKRNKWLPLALLLFIGFLMIIDRESDVDFWDDYTPYFLINILGILLFLFSFVHAFWTAVYIEAVRRKYKKSLTIKEYGLEWAFLVLLIDSLIIMFLTNVLKSVF